MVPDLLFGWVTPLVRRGAAAPQLEYADLLAGPTDASPRAASAALWHEWTQVRVFGLLARSWGARGGCCFTVVCLSTWWSSCRQQQQCVCMSHAILLLALLVPTQVRARGGRSLLHAIHRAYGGPFYRLAVLKVWPLTHWCMCRALCWCRQTGARRGKALSTRQPGLPSEAAATAAAAHGNCACA